MFRRLLRRRVLVPLIALVAVAAGGAVVFANVQPKAVQYRTAAAVRGTVTQTLPISGNLAAANQTDLDFGSSGRVATVNVVGGQAVHAGDVLATLDTASLEGALTQAQANLASAQAKYSLDAGGPTVQNLAQAQSTVNTAAVQLTNSQVSQVDTRLVNDQSINQAQAAADAAQGTLNADQGQETSDCNADPSSQACATDHQNVARDQSALSQANANVGATRAKAQQGNDQAQAAVNQAAVALQNAQAALVALRQGGTPQQLTMDGSSVQVAQVNVDTAQRNLDAATIRAPVDGVVSAVNITVGSTASNGSGSSSGASTSSASSTTHAVSLLTPGSYVVTGAVSDAQVGQVAIGQAARVTPAGSTQALTGKVSAIAAVATVTSGVASFPVTVTIDGSNPSLHAGTSAAVSIIINQATQVLTVPTSAVRNGSSVQVLVNGKAETRAITIGASDSLRTQVMSGLNEGDEVITATVSSTVPTTNSSANPLTGGGGGRGNFGGGGGGRGPGGRLSAIDDTIRRDGAELIRLDSVTKVYGQGDAEVRAVDGVSLGINTGEFTAIMGPSGSGKSTLMHILGCLDTPTRGRYHFAGEDVSRMTESQLARVRNRRIGFVFQQFHLLPSMSAWRNVELPLLYRSATDRRAAAMAALEQVGLGDRVHHKPTELSGGQQQRVAIARALVTDPDLILADEPTGNLDSTSSREVLAILQGLNAAGRTVIIITHDPEVGNVPSRVVAMSDGRIREPVAA